MLAFLGRRLDKPATTEYVDWIRGLAHGNLGDSAVGLAQGEKHGYRNAQVTVIAPTGTIGFGRISVSSRRRVPRPPQRMKTGTCETSSFNV